MHMPVQLKSAEIGTCEAQVQHHVKDGDGML